MRSLRRVISAVRTSFRSPAVIVYARLASLILGLFATLITARGLGPAGRGDAAAALSALYLVPICAALGLPLVVRRQAAHNRTEASVRTIRLLALLLTVPCCVVGLLLVLFPLASLDDSAKLAAFVGIAVAPITVLWLADQSVLVAKNRYLGVATIQGAQPAIFCALLLAAWATHHIVVWVVLAANIAGSLATFFTSSLLTRVPLRGPRLPVRNALREGLTYAGSQASEAASNRLDQVYLLPLMGAHAVGLYSVAATVGAAPLTVAYALSASTYTAIATSEGSERHAHQAAAARAALYWAIAVSAAAAAASYVLIPIVFGDKFADARIPTLICVLGSSAMVVAQVCGNALAAANRGLVMTLSQLGGLVMAVVLALWLASQYGASGAAAASSGGYAVAALMLLYFAKIRVHHLVPNASRIRHAAGTLLKA
jgi:O-antigen/teichoic acid export membrane protein